MIEMLLLIKQMVGCDIRQFYSLCARILCKYRWICDCSCWVGLGQYVTTDQGFWCSTEAVVWAVIDGVGGGILNGWNIPLLQM